MDVSWACEIGDPCLDNEISLTVYDAILKFSVSDRTLLWKAAARRLMRGGLGLDDVQATIGFADDPLVEACLTALILPLSIEGSDLIDFEIGLDVRSTVVAGAREALSALSH